MHQRPEFTWTTPCSQTLALKPRLVPMMMWEDKEIMMEASSCQRLGREVRPVLTMVATDRAIMATITNLVSINKIMQWSLSWCPGRRVTRGWWSWMIITIKVPLHSNKEIQMLIIGRCLQRKIKKYFLQPITAAMCLVLNWFLKAKSHSSTTIRLLLPSPARTKVKVWLHRTTTQLIQHPAILKWQGKTWSPSRRLSTAESETNPKVKNFWLSDYQQSICVPFLKPVYLKQLINVKCSVNINPICL